MSTTGNKGRFSERLKRIALRKRKKFQKEEVEDSDKIYTNFLKVVSAIPGVIYGNLYNDNNSNNDTLSNKISKIEKMSLEKGMTTVDSRQINQKEIRNAIDRINIENIREQQALFIKNNDNSKKNASVFDWKSDEKSRALKVQKLEKSILDIIKQRLIKSINEMEMLQSELYVLSEITSDTTELKECQEEVEKIKALLEKVRVLKEQYDFLKDNYDFEYLLEIDDNSLVDKIIELKDMFGNNEVKALVQDYKLLEEYKYLYLKMDDLTDKMVDFEKTKQDQIEELKQRDIDFEKFKNNVYNIDAANNKYNQFVKEQNYLMQQIDENIDSISNHEVVNYRLKGFNKLFLNSFKYFGLLMLNPLKGIIPSIATETLITKNMVHNLYKNLAWEEKRKIVYEAIDYSGLIASAIDDLDSTNRIVDATLDDIVRLKMQYNDQFKKYQGDFREYTDIMKKMNDMENEILGNKIKIEMMRKKALEQERANKQKLKLVNKLNND